MGDKAAAYFQKIIELDQEIPDELKRSSVRLVAQYVEDKRTANDKFVPASARSLSGKNPGVSLADGFPVYVNVTESSKCQIFMCD